jgi:hypothetical protein
MNKTLLQFLLEQKSNIEEYETNIDLWARLDKLDQDQLQYLQDRFRFWYKDKGFDFSEAPDPFKGDADLPHYLGGKGPGRPVPDEPPSAMLSTAAQAAAAQAAAGWSDYAGNVQHSAQHGLSQSYVPKGNLLGEHQTFSNFWSTINEAKRPRSLAGGGYSAQEFPEDDEPKKDDDKKDPYPTVADIAAGDTSDVQTQPETPASVGPPKDEPAVEVPKDQPADDTAVAGEEEAGKADAHEVYEDVVSGETHSMKFKQPSGPTDFNNEIFKITHRVLLYITKRMASGKPEGAGPRIPYELGPDEYDTDPGYKEPSEPSTKPSGEVKGSEDQSWFGTKDMWNPEMVSDRESFDCSDLKSVQQTKWILNTVQQIDKYPNISKTAKRVFNICRIFRDKEGVVAGPTKFWCKEFHTKKKRGIISKIMKKSMSGEELQVGDIVWAFNEFIKAGIMIGVRPKPNDPQDGDLFSTPDEQPSTPRFSPDVAPADWGPRDSPRYDWYSQIKQQGMVAEVLGLLGKAGIPVHEINTIGDVLKTRETLPYAPSTGGERSAQDARAKEYPVSKPAANLRGEPGPPHTQLGLGV